MDAPRRETDDAAREAAETPFDFDLRPFSVIWEVTRACDLRCVHCRADARSSRDPRELTSGEGFALLDQIRDLGSPVFVLTGGDPLKRPDVYELVDHAVRRGLAVAVTPSGTPLLTADAVQRLSDLGVRRMALSLDGSTRERHDGFRRQVGSWDTTVAAVRAAREVGLPVQVNTTVTRRNICDLPSMARLVEDLGAAMWSAFFLITVGRANAADQLSPQECEEVFAFLYELSKVVSFGVRTTAAPHYRRFVVQRRRDEKRAGASPSVRDLVGVVGEMRAPRGVTDGNGLLFISHAGDVYPSGFLPISAGNVRRRPLADIYRNSPIFRRLRDASRLDGKCGACEFRRLCGGSRARAYACTGNPMAEDPACVYVPRRHVTPPTVDWTG